MEAYKENRENTLEGRSSPKHYGESLKTQTWVACGISEVEDENSLEGHAWSRGSPRSRAEPSPREHGQP